MRFRKRVTLSDVAVKAGVSKQTVSRVINNKPDVSASTRKHVQTIIKAMGYIPDPIARSMKGKTKTLGCITPNFTDYNFAAIIQSAQNIAQENGYSIMFASAKTGMQFIPVLEEMVNRRVDGIFVINPRDDHRFHFLLPLIAQGFPVVYLNNLPIDEPVSAICLDDEHGGFLAAQYLLSLGHTSIATIRGPESETCSNDRFVGFQKAHLDQNISPDLNLVISGDWSAESGKNATRKLINYGARFSAIFAHNDLMAIGAIQALNEIGLQVPQDVSVIGFDDLPIAPFLNPPLTTIKLPVDQFGELAVKVLIDTINQEDYQPEVIRLTPTLVKRSTCRQYNK